MQCNLRACRAQRARWGPHTLSHPVLHLLSSCAAQSNLRDAILQRAVFTRSDLTGADIFGADFTNALVDKTQQLALCKYADGVNSVTGVSTRKSLGCGSRRAFKAASPSSSEGPQASDDEKAAFARTLPTYRE